MECLIKEGAEKVPCVVAVAGQPESGNHGFRRSSVIRPAIIACAEKGRLSLSERARARTTPALYRDAPRMRTRPSSALSGNYRCGAAVK